MHKSANYIRPDEAAECLDIPMRSPLYAALWELTKHYTKIDFEECGPADVVGINSLASLWHLLPAELHDEMNAALESYAAEMESWQAAP